MMNHTQDVRTIVRPAISLLLGVGLVASVAITTLTLNTGFNLPVFGSHAATAVLPQAYVADGAGEGLVGPTSSRSVAAIKAHVQPYMGEGRENVAALRAFENLPYITYDANLYSGEGRNTVAVLRSTEALPYITYDAPTGMGEGWLAGATRQADAAITAHSSCGQGEGLLQQRVALENPCDQD